MPSCSRSWPWRRAATNNGAIPLCPSKFSPSQSDSERFQPPTVGEVNVLRGRVHGGPGGLGHVAEPGSGTLARTSFGTDSWAGKRDGDMNSNLRTEFAGCGGGGSGYGVHTHAPEAGEGQRQQTRQELRRVNRVAF